MSNLTIYTMDKKPTGEVTLPAEWGTLKVKTALIFNAVQAALTNKRQGTVKTKRSGEVRGSGKKPYKQKGTGNARHGSFQSPLFNGGGQTFGPQPRDYHDRLPATQKRAALLHALVQKQRDGKVVIVNELHCADGKTKAMVQTLKTLGVAKGVIVLASAQDDVVRATRNIPGITVRDVRCLNAHDLVKYDTLLLTKDAWDKVAERVAS